MSSYRQKYRLSVLVRETKETLEFDLELPLGLSEKQIKSFLKKRRPELKILKIKSVGLLKITD